MNVSKQILKSLCRGAVAALPALFAAVLSISCTELAPGQEETLLKSFALKASGVNYHAEIDIEQHTARIGSIQYGGQVDGAEYVLADGSTIDPLPESIGEWPQTQTFTITNGERVEKYTVILSAYVAAWPDSRYLVLAEQKRYYAAIVDANTQQIVWNWDISRSGLPAEHQPWFRYPTEVKPVYNGTVLLVVNNDGVGLIRRSDHRMVWYAATGGGFPHSAEVLPDGNIAVVYSTNTNPNPVNSDKLKIFKVDYSRFPADDAVVAEYDLKSGHSVVWDRKNEVLWATTYGTVNRYAYGLRDGVPSLDLQKSISLPAGAKDAHDLFPVYGERKLWLTTSEHLYKFDPDSQNFEEFNVAEGLDRLKSVSSGPAGYPTIVLHPADEDGWCSNQLVTLDGVPVYTGPEELQIYKGRWLLDNTFSYAENQRLPEGI